MKQVIIDKNFIIDKEQSKSMSSCLYILVLDIKMTFCIQKYVMFVLFNIGCKY